MAIMGRGLFRSLLIRTVTPGTQVDDIYYPGSHGLLMGCINGIPRPFSVSIKWIQDCPVLGLRTITMGLYTKSLVLLAVAVAQTIGAIYDQVSQLPTHTYDYVIVGGTLHETAP